jgi:hypothetical protein
MNVFDAIGNSRRHRRADAGVATLEAIDPGPGGPTQTVCAPNRALWWRSYVTAGDRVASGGRFAASDAREAELPRPPLSEGALVRRLVYFIATSLGGRIAGPDGTDPTSFWPIGDDYVQHLGSNHPRRPGRAG